MKTILLARHGQASFGKDNYDKLSDLGIQQAQVLGQHFADNKRQIDHIVTGTLLRQRDTAKHFCKPFLLDSGSSIPVSTLAQLNEFDHEEVLLKYCHCNTMADFRAKYADQNLSTQQLVSIFQQSMIRWHSGEHDQDYTESWSQFAQRSQEGLQQIIDNMQEGQTSLVFTSGGVIASIVSHLLPQPQGEQISQTDEQRQYTYAMNAFTINNQLVNTGITTVIINEQAKQGKLLTLNACDHLLLAGQEYLTWF